MPIAYSATTDGATFLLDEQGVCRRVMLRRGLSTQVTMGGRTRAQAANRMVGAQYVASIDTSVTGGLIPMPKAGAPMLFAYQDESGRLAVARTGPLVLFETLSDNAITAQVPDIDDDCRTVPIPAFGAARRARGGSVPGPVTSEVFIDVEDTLSDAWPMEDAPLTLPRPPTDPHLRLRAMRGTRDVRDGTVKPDNESATTLPRLSRDSAPPSPRRGPTPGPTTARKGMLPRRAGRG